MVRWGLRALFLDPSLDGRGARTADGGVGAFGHRDDVRRLSGDDAGGAAGRSRTARPLGLLRGRPAWTFPIVGRGFDRNARGRAGAALAVWRRKRRMRCRLTDAKRARDRCDEAAMIARHRTVRIPAGPRPHPSISALAYDQWTVAGARPAGIYAALQGQLRRSMPARSSTCRAATAASCRTPPSPRAVLELARRGAALALFHRSSRKDRALWSQVVIYTSLLGTFLTPDRALSRHPPIWARQAPHSLSRDGVVAPCDRAGVRHVHADVGRQRAVLDEPVGG